MSENGDYKTNMNAEDFGWRRVEVSHVELTKTQKKNPAYYGPGAIAHHTISVHEGGKEAYLFGGSDGYNQNNYFYRLDLESMKWEVIDNLENRRLASSRDGHTAVMFENHNLILYFGGFIGGERTNDIAMFEISNMKWSNYNSSIKPSERHRFQLPCARNGHTACRYKNTMFVYGGKDDEGNKLNDLWGFDLEKLVWTQLQEPSEIKNH